MQLICNINAKKIQWYHTFIPVHILPRGLQNPQKNHMIIQFLNKFPQQTSPRYIFFEPITIVPHLLIFPHHFNLLNPITFSRMPLHEIILCVSVRNGNHIQPKPYEQKLIYVRVRVCVCVRICRIDVQEPSSSDMLICDSCQHLKTC